MLALRLSTRKSKTHKKLWQCPLKRLDEYKKLYSRNQNNISKKKKRIPNMRFWNIHILVQISFFRGLLHCILVKFFFVRQLWWLTFLFSDGIFTVTSQLEITIIGSRHDFSKKKNPLFFDVNLKTIHQEEIFVNSLVYHTKEPLKWGTLSSCFSYNIWIKTNESVTFERPAMLISCYVAKKNKNEIQ